MDRVSLLGKVLPSKLFHSRWAIDQESEVRDFAKLAFRSQLVKEDDLLLRNHIGIPDIQALMAPEIDPALLSITGSNVSADPMDQTLCNVQFKIADAVGPLLLMLDKAEKEGSSHNPSLTALLASNMALLKASSRALLIIGQSFNYISNIRRTRWLHAAGIRAFQASRSPFGPRVVPTGLQAPGKLLSKPTFVTMGESQDPQAVAEEPMPDVAHQETEDPCSQALAQGKIELADLSISGWISPLFPIPKSDGTWRPVLNVKALNAFLKRKRFRMEGLTDLPGLVPKNVFCIKLYLKDAFHSVPIAMKHRCFLRFRWKEQIYHRTVMVVGLSNAPYTFSRIMKAIISHVRQRGFLCLYYLDDILLLNPEVDTFVQQIDYLISLLQDLRFIVNLQKSILVPTQNILFLGFMLDTMDMTLGVPRDKWEKILAQITSALLKHRWSLREIAKTVGRLIALTPGYDASPLLCRQSQLFLGNQLRWGGQWGSRVVLPTSVRKELNKILEGASPLPLGSC
ncbi:Hypothetical predicted protein [Pelobates cultripes]|uniref:ribonuclease H n=1 Tax=Pelobates cultripes TaxID=61616 RepID=A0AAD1SMP7_PELCU|nr:Hypothetical predicted protein [Pelobates cultripes]